MSNIAEALWCPDDDLQMVLAKRIGETLIVSPDVCAVCGTEGARAEAPPRRGAAPL